MPLIYALEYFFLRASSTGHYTLFIYLPEELLNTTLDLSVTPQEQLQIKTGAEALYLSKPLPIDLLHFLKHTSCQCFFIDHLAIPLFSVTLSPERLFFHTQ